MAEFGRVVIFGVGLIGGSFALALKAAGAVDEVVGFGRSVASLKRAQERGIIDRIGIGIGSEVPEADLVLVATPVAQMAEVFERTAPYLSKDTAVTDGGSTKANVVAAARSALGERISRFVPAHPIAGTENSGPDAAFAELYHGRKVVLTPLAESDPEAVLTVRAAWTRCGAEVRELSPEAHDRVFAAVSHLPHLLSYALVHDLAVREDCDQFFSYAASGFRDFTRIAASHPEMWRDICLANRVPLIEELDRYMAQLNVLRGALADVDGDTLEQVFDTARIARRDWDGRRSP